MDEFGNDFTPFQPDDSGSFEEPFFETEVPQEDHEEVVLSEETLSFRERVANVWYAAREDFSRTGRGGKALLLGYVANIGYELFIGNEVIAPLLGGQTLDTAKGIGGIVASAAITSLPVYLQQRLGGFLSRGTAQQFPNVSEAAYKALNNDDEEDTTYRHFDDLPPVKVHLPKTIRIN